jgi:hypothetical protein
MTFGEQKWVAKKQKYSLKRIQDFASRSDFGKTKSRLFKSLGVILLLSLRLPKSSSMLVFVLASACSI